MSLNEEIKIKNSGRSDLSFLFARKFLSLHKMEKGGGVMRRRCNGAPTQWLGGILLIAVGVGMLLACLIPKCVFLIGAVFIAIGVWLISK